MFRFIDRSEVLSKFFVRFTNFMAKRRGLPIIVGIALVILSFILQVVEVYADSQALQLMGVTVQHIGILLALIGLLLSDALGN